MAAMLETSSTSAPEASPGCDVLASLHGVIERQDAELKFKQSKIEALNFEIARLKRWRFGSSSESLDNSAQTVLFDLIVADTREEDAAALAASPALPATPAVPPVAPLRAVRKAFPAELPRIDHHHEIDATHCACGQAFKRVGEEISEQLDCVPAQFFVQRNFCNRYDIFSIIDPIVCLHMSVFPPSSSIAPHSHCGKFILLRSICQLLKRTEDDLQTRSCISS